LYWSDIEKVNTHLNINVKPCTEDVVFRQNVKLFEIYSRTGSARYF